MGNLRYRKDCPNSAIGVLLWQEINKGDMSSFNPDNALMLVSVEGIKLCEEHELMGGL